jgi:hypothetical protein
LTNGPGRHVGLRLLKKSPQAMSNHTSFTIDKVAWHTKTPGNPETREHMWIRFFTITKFLQDNGLLVRKLLDSEDEITEDFAIRSDDLTDTGLTFMKAAYNKWLKDLDAGAEPTDVSLLEKHLRKIKEAS